MRWFRANRILGGRLALFALAVQIVLSFGHIHREDIYGAAIGSASPAASVALPAADDSQPLPADRTSHHANDYCAICATIHLLSAAFVAEAPPLALPFVSYAIDRFDRVAVVFIAPRRAPFQSRAPPLV